MRQFKDSEGRSWDIKVTTNVIERAKSLINVDITDLYMETGSRVFADPVLLVNLLFVVCKDQAEKRELTDVQFGEAMFGDALQDGANALMESVADFFPSSKRKMLDAQRLKAKELGEAAISKATAAIEALTLEQFLKPAGN
jgi:hypothetical protein